MSPHRRRLVAQRQRRKCFLRLGYVGVSMSSTGHLEWVRLAWPHLTLTVEPYDGPLIFHSPRVSFG